MISCGNTNSSNQTGSEGIKEGNNFDTQETENYAAEKINFDYASETELLKQYPIFSKGEAIQFTYDFNCYIFYKVCKEF